MSNGQWHAKFREAILETAPRKLLERIAIAEKAIWERSLYSEKLSKQECISLDSSLDQLRILKQERATPGSTASGKRAT